MRILDRYGYIPSELRDDGGLDSGILAHPEHWRAAIYHDLVLLKDPGSRFTFVQCRHSLRRHGIELQGTVDLMTQIIDRFLKHLHRQGVVCRCRNKWSCEIDYVQVVATIEMAEEARQQQAQRDEEERLADQQRRRREKERRVQQAATVFAARRTRQTRSLTASADAPVRQDEQATVPCRA